jgi:hypothetical protein
MCLRLPPTVRSIVEALALGRELRGLGLADLVRLDWLPLATDPGALDAELAALGRVDPGLGLAALRDAWERLSKGSGWIAAGFRSSPRLIEEAVYDFRVPGLDKDSAAWLRTLVAGARGDPVGFAARLPWLWGELCVAVGDTPGLAFPDFALGVTLGYFLRSDAPLPSDDLLVALRDAAAFPEQPDPERPDPGAPADLDAVLLGCQRLSVIGAELGARLPAEAPLAERLAAAYG